MSDEGLQSSPLGGSKFGVHLEMLPNLSLKLSGQGLAPLAFLAASSLGGSLALRWPETILDNVYTLTYTSAQKEVPHEDCLFH